MTRDNRPTKGEAPVTENDETGIDADVLDETTGTIAAPEVDEFGEPEEITGPDDEPGEDPESPDPDDAGATDETEIPDLPDDDVREV